MKHLHPRAVWLFFWQAFFGLIIFLIIFSMFLGPGVITLFVVLSRTGKLPGLSLLLPLFVGVLFLLIYFIAIYIWARLAYDNYRYQLTEDAVKIEKGVIWKKYISIPYERIQNVDIYRGILARLLGLSDLQIQTAGYTGYARTEGKLPGLDPQVAEELREELIKTVRGTK